MAKSEFQQTTKNAGIIGMTAFGGALMGFILNIVISYYFGIGKNTDAYLMAQSTSELLGKLLLGGSIVAVFIPIFVEQLNKDGKTLAWKSALNIMHITAALYVLLLIVVALFTTPFVHLIAPGFDSAAIILTVQLLRILLPSFFFLFLVELGTAMLQSVRHFTIPASLRIIAPLVSILSIVAFVQTLGIYSLAIGALIGAAVQIALIIWALKKQGFSYAFVFHPASPTIKKLIRLVYPFIFSMLVTFAAGIVYRVLVSHLPEGSLTSLKWAEKITQMTTLIFLTSIVSAMYPLLSEKASRGDMGGLKDSLASAVRLIFFISMPLLIGLSMLRQPLISLIYGHGSVTTQGVAQTSIALLFLSIGLVTNGISAVFGNATVAIQKTKAAVAITIASQMVAIILFYLLTPRMGHAGLALASSLVPLASGLMYMFYLGNYIPRMWTMFIHATYLKTIALSVVLYGVVQMVIPLTTRLEIGSTATAAMQVFIPALIGGTVYVAGAHTIHVPEVREVAGILGRKLKKFL
ncbi:MAG: polysaccharide biosynthesis C-terminal domain-containing protein [Candidatus Andersenbacteria bacterium]|nr:polysaccharide biosynthesis C-terminal domain-containing protein [Candidatus Andersenbacteria bacterium]